MSRPPNRKRSSLTLELRGGDSSRPSDNLVRKEYKRHDSTGRSHLTPKDPFVSKPRLLETSRLPDTYLRSFVPPPLPWPHNVVPTSDGPDEYTEGPRSSHPLRAKRPFLGVVIRPSENTFIPAQFFLVRRVSCLRHPLRFVIRFRSPRPTTSFRNPRLSWSPFTRRPTFLLKIRPPRVGRRQDEEGSWAHFSGDVYVESVNHRHSRPVV